MQRSPYNALDGLRVIECCWIMAGPIAGQLLADQGAEVIRVETPLHMDALRVQGPWLNGVDTMPDGSGAFASFNRGKKSIVLDLKTARGHALFLQLVEHADVVLDNYAAGVMGRLGLDYSVLSAANPRIVVLSSSGMGLGSGYDSVASHGPITQAMSGWCAVTGNAGYPLLTGFTISDFASGYFAAAAITAALVEREHSGKGQFIDLSQLDVMCWLTSELQLASVLAGEDGEADGGGEDDWYLSESLRCAGEDVWTAVVIREDRALLGTAELLFGADASRRTLKQSGVAGVLGRIREVLPGWCLSRDRTEVVRALRHVGCEAEPIQSIRDLMEDDERLRRRKFYGPMQHMFGDTVSLDGVPYVMDGDFMRNRPLAPLLGEHTDEVLSGVLRLQPDEVADLRAQGVVA